LERQEASAKEAALRYSECVRGFARGRSVVGSLEGVKKVAMYNRVRECEGSKFKGDRISESADARPVKFSRKHRSTRKSIE
jgi:hypothetical protein